MKTVFKYGLQRGMNIVHIPGGLSEHVGIATIAHQPGQQEPVQMWVFIDEKAEPVEEHIYLAGTGEGLPDAHCYYHIGTALIHGGGNVLHALYIRQE